MRYCQPAPPYLVHRRQRLPPLAAVHWSVVVEDQRLARRQVVAIVVRTSEHREAAIAQHAPAGAVALVAHIRQIGTESLGFRVEALRIWGLSQV
jgi:hypothetical protein